MIKIDLERLIKDLEGKLNRKVTLSEVAEKSGVHRSILSRIINRPQENTSTEHIEKLAQYLFYAHKEATPEWFDDHEDEYLMQLILGKLVQVFPEKGNHASLLKKLSETGSVVDMPIFRLWEFHKASLPPKVEQTPISEANKKLAAKLAKEKPKSKKRKTR